MKTIVIYNSQTGFTKRYAEWIAGECGADCFDLGMAKKNQSPSLSRSLPPYHSENEIRLWIYSKKQPT